MRRVPPRGELRDCRLDPRGRGQNRGADLAPRRFHRRELEAVLAGIDSVDVVAPPAQDLHEEVADEATAHD